MKHTPDRSPMQIAYHALNTTAHDSDCVPTIATATNNTLADAIELLTRAHKHLVDVVLATRPALASHSPSTSEREPTVDS